MTGPAIAMGLVTGCKSFYGMSQTPTMLKALKSLAIIVYLIMPCHSTVASFPFFIGLAGMFLIRNTWWAFAGSMILLSLIVLVITIFKQRSKLDKFLIPITSFIMMIPFLVEPGLTTSFYEGLMSGLLFSAFIILIISVNILTLKAAKKLNQ